MAARGWIFMAALLCLETTLGHSHRGETDTYHVSVGRLFLLRCLSADAHTNVSWSREGGYNLPTGVEVRDGLLWFLPVQTSHSGSYTCEKRCRDGGSSRITFGVSVSSAECPETLETVHVTKGANDGLPCKQTEIFKLNNTGNVRWMKDCQPVGKPLSLGKEGFMRLSAVTERDDGKYTCLVDVSVDGRKYTAARSIRLTTGACSLIAEPKVEYPKQEVVVVKKGGSKELKCSALIGPCENNETSMYWSVGEGYVEDYEELNESYRSISERGRIYGQSTLSITKVLPQFLNVPISCHVSNSAGGDVGVMWLQEADHRALYTSVALCLAASLAVLSLAAAFFFFKVDLVLVHRKLLRRFSKQQAVDGKSYDAYVSFLHPDTLSSAETESFALQILPEELERKHGYSLYIRGRDDCPGEAVHDVISTTVRQCRRLIIVLSSAIKSSSCSKIEVALMHENPNQLCYEQKVGLYDALTQNDPRVILVEIDGPVDYSVLPESLRYIKRKQGALKWRKSSLGTQKLSQKLHSNRNFWKNLRYHMPPVPSGRLQTVV